MSWGLTRVHGNCNVDRGFWPFLNCSGLVAVAVAVSVAVTVQWTRVV